MIHDMFNVLRQVQVLNPTYTAFSGLWRHGLTTSYLLSLLRRAMDLHITIEFLGPT